MPTDRPLRIAYLAYRGNPHSGGQGVYTRHLTKQLVDLGHQVTVFGGQPYPVLDDGVEFVPVPSLDLYREPDPSGSRGPASSGPRIDVLEFALMCTAGFPEPLTFSLRARKVLADRRADFDVVHDNQCLGNGLLGMIEDGWPLLGDRSTTRSPSTASSSWPTPAPSAAHHAAPLVRVPPHAGAGGPAAAPHRHRVGVVAARHRRPDGRRHRPHLRSCPSGVDTDRFRPLPHIARVPGRLMTTASADVPLKGLVPLLEAVAKVRTERHAELVVIGKPRSQSKVGATIARLGLDGAVTFVNGVTDERIVELYAEAEVAVVPSLYEGFSLPAVEAMACGVPLVATTGGALPEVVGTDGETGLLVPPGDPGALAAAIGRALDDPELRARLGAAGRERVLEKFTWRATAVGTVEQYRRLLDGARRAARADRRLRPARRVPGDRLLDLGCGGGRHAFEALRRGAGRGPRRRRQRDQGRRRPA